MPRAGGGAPPRGRLPVVSDLRRCGEHGSTGIFSRRFAPFASQLLSKRDAYGHAHCAPVSAMLRVRLFFVGRSEQREDQVMEGLETEHQG
jgi:hypothetical protein